MFTLKRKFTYVLLILSGILISNNSLSQDFLPKLDQVKSLERDTNNFYLNQIWILSKDINSNDSEGFLRRAADKTELGYYKEALIDVNKAINLDSSLSHCYSLKGFIMLKCDSIHSALLNFNKAISLNDTNVYNFIYSAEIYLSMRKFHEADSLYNRAISMDQMFAKGYFGLANLYFLKGECELAEKQYKKVLKLDPEFSQAYLNIAIMYLFTDPVKSRRNLNMAVKVNPRFAHGYYLTGYLDMLQGNTSAALKNWNKAIELDSLNNLYHISRGFFKISNNDYVSGFNEITSILSNSKVKDFINDFEKSDKERHTGDFLDQALTYTRYSDRISQNEKNELITAMCLFYLGKYDLADNIYQKQIKTTSSPGLVHYLRGYNFEYYQMPDLSINSYISAINQITFPYEAFLRHGIILNLKGRYREAIQSLNRYLESNDSSRAAYLTLANSFLNISQYDSAIFNYNRLLDFDSTQLDVYIGRAFCFKKLEQYQDAINDYSHLIKYRPLDIESICLLAECKFLSSDTTGALDLLNQTCNHFFYLSETGYYIRGKINLLQMNYDSAIVNFNEVVKFKIHSDDVLTLRGVAYYCKEDYTNAKIDLTTAISLNKDDVAAIYTLALVNIKLNELPEAYNNLKRAELLGHPLARRTSLIYLKDYKPDSNN